MSKELSSITIYKDNRNTLTKLVQRICEKNQCSTEAALDALTTLFKNSVPADYEGKIEESLKDYSDFKKLFENKTFEEESETTDLNDILYGHSIEISKKGICKITEVKGDVITVSCPDGTTDNVSYKEYFGTPTLTESVTIDDVTQYGDNLLVTLNGHLYAYQPLADSGKSVEDLLKSVKGMMKHSVGKALAYLKKNSVLVPETSKTNK